MGKASMPPGFRFSPTDTELVQYYMKRKVMGKKFHSKFITEVEIHKYHPWDLPDKACWQSGDLKWYFFCPTEKKYYQKGARVRRITAVGFWKATGKDRSGLYDCEIAGWIKTLVFYTSKSPKIERTDWVMYEYRLEAKNLADKGVPQDSYVLCMVFHKDGPGPRNGAQYGAPVIEEDWSEDEVEPCAITPEPNLELPSNYNSSINCSSHSPEGICIGPSSESRISEVLPSSCNVLKLISSNHVTVEKPHVPNDYILEMWNGLPEGSCSKLIENAKNVGMQIGSSSESCVSEVLPPWNVFQSVSSNHVTMKKPQVPNDDILSMLNCFTEGSTSKLKENDKNEELGNIIHSGNACVTPLFNREDIYRDLGGLGKMGRMSEHGCNLSSPHPVAMDDSTVYS